MRIGIMSTLIIQIFSMENVLCKLHFRFVKNSAVFKFSIHEDKKNEIFIK